jgi:hypothetical protein
MPCADARPTQLLLFLRILPPRVNSDPGGALIAGGLGTVFVQTFGLERRAIAQDTAGALNFTRNAQFSVIDAPNSFKDISTYVRKLGLEILACHARDDAVTGT